MQLVTLVVKLVHELNSSTFGSTSRSAASSTVHQASPYKAQHQRIDSP
jgi:hypothetical protein